METDKLIRAMRDWAKQIPMPGRHKLLTEAADRLEELEKQPDVVRCKDCKHYVVEDHYGNFHGYEILAASGIPTCHRWGNDACMVKPDGYCFLAERRLE